LFETTIKQLHRLNLRYRINYCRVWLQSWFFPPPPKGKFPPVWMAVKQPWGLLAVGGVLTADTLLQAYAKGIYPFYDKHPVKWFSGNPRAVLFPEKMRIEKGWRKLVQSGRYRVTFDSAFEEVVRQSSNRTWTWLIPERIDVAVALHKRGQAHSVEVWNQDGHLVGGAFGVDMGRVFIGESAFSLEKNVMHVAFIHLICHLQQWGYVLNDAQGYGGHLKLMGFEKIPRKQYVNRLQELANIDIRCEKWVVDDRLDVGNWIPSVPGSQLKGPAQA